MQEVTLKNGVKMAPIGFGTWQLRDGEEAVNSVRIALKTGYRLVDTAKIYGNERSVGQAVKGSEVSRDEIFVTTKLWTTDLGYASAKRNLADSLARLDLDYIDLYLIHWPGMDVDARKDSWKAMVEMFQAGQVKAIGVSNFNVEQIKEIGSAFGIIPSVNQIEFHPYVYYQQQDLLEYCREQEIVVEAYSPLARGLIDNDILSDIGSQYGKTTSQVMLRWAIQKGTIPLPRSSNPDHIAENYKVFDFELADEQMVMIDKLSR